MIEANKIYLIIEEFLPELNITQYQYKRKRADLLEWLTEFYDYELINTNPKKIKINAVYAEYQPLPRKGYSIENRKAKTAHKETDYLQFTIAELGNEWKPNSKSNIARKAIESFAKEKYGHDNVQGVAQRHVGPVMDTYGEKTNERYWVWYVTYTIVEQDIKEEWLKILEEEHLSEKEAANAFYKHAQGEDVSKEINYYKKAQNRFKEIYGDILVSVSKWKLKGLATGSEELK